MTDLFGDEIVTHDLVTRLTDAYRERLLSNPPTPAFMPSNPKAEGFAFQIAKKDVTRFLCVCGELGLELVETEELAGLRAEHHAPPQFE